MIWLELARLWSIVVLLAPPVAMLCLVAGVVRPARETDVVELE